MDVFDRRREKLRELLLSVSAAELARSSGVSASYISRCLKEPLQDGYKTIGEVTARKLESGAKKPEGWLDNLGERISAQNSKPNHALAPVYSAQPATNLIACLTYLTDYLQGLDPSDRKAAMVQIASLVDEPERCAKVVASIEAMAGTGFAQAGQKAA